MNAAVHPEATTAAGRVRGLRREDGTLAFLGIPYAEPPVGELRFAAPVPHRPWQGVRDALAQGATPKRAVPGELTLIPEPAVPGDATLNVNVFTPALDGRAPVLVYLHGGGFTEGSPASPWYDGASFARDGVVTVVPSYRLGFDGFGWIADAPGNRALRDWLLALRWVQENIAAFGGDPGRVTIAGQSAGGTAVLTLLAMPDAAGLFHACYAISAPDCAIDAERAEQLGRRVAELGGVEPTRVALSKLDEPRIRELQREAEKPVNGARTAALRELLADGLAWAPVIDDELLPRHPFEAIGTGAAAQIPLVIGANDDEISMALDGLTQKLRWMRAWWVLARAGVPRARRRAWFAANPGLRGRSTARIVGRYLSDHVFRRIVPQVLAARGEGPTWSYRFAWPSTKSGIALHCLDVPFFFDLLDERHVEGLTGANPPQELADAVHGAAVAFINDHDPGWPRESTHVFALPASEDPDAYAEARALL